MSREKKWPYEDIVNLPHHVSDTHAPMPMEKRAAQFAPFAALTGYEDAVEETARLTDEKIMLSETEIDELNRRIRDAISEKRRITIRYFVPDEKKSGGSYETVSGRIKKTESGEIVLENGLRIPAEDVAGVQED